MSHARQQASGAAILALLVGAIAGLIYWYVSPPSPPSPLTAEEQEYGRKPALLNLGHTKIAAPLYKHILASLKDPDSLQIIAASEPQTKDASGMKGWMVTAEYRAKNSFGGYVVERVGAIVRDGTIIHAETIPDSH